MHVNSSSTKCHPFSVRCNCAQLQLYYRCLAPVLLDRFRFIPGLRTNLSIIEEHRQLQAICICDEQWLRITRTAMYWFTFPYLFTINQNYILYAARYIWQFNWPMDEPTRSQLLGLVINVSNTWISEMDNNVNKTQKSHFDSVISCIFLLRKYIRLPLLTRGICFYH